MERSTICLNNARNCLRIFLRNIKVKEIWCPYKICSVVFKAIQKEGVRIKFYHIDENFYPAQKFGSDDFILYPNYFGICDKQAQLMAETYPNFIYDSAQSLYSKPLGIASIYSLRKFLPVTDGGLLITKIPISANNLKTEDDTEPFLTKSSTFEYEKFLKNELKFNQSDEIKTISKMSKDIYSKVNIQSEQHIRIEKFNNFHEKYGHFNKLKICSELESPMVYPLKTDNKELIQELLKEDKLYLQYEYMKDIFPIPLN